MKAAPTFCPTLFVALVASIGMSLELVTIPRGGRVSELKAPDRERHAPKECPDQHALGWLAENRYIRTDAQSEIFGRMKAANADQLRVRLSSQPRQ